MYRLAPHSTFNKVVAATDIMYHMPSYHEESDIPVTVFPATPASISLSNEVTAEKLLEQQVALIKRISTFTKSMQQCNECSALKIQSSSTNAVPEDGRKAKSIEKSTKKSDKVAKKEALNTAATLKTGAYSCYKENGVPFTINNGKPVSVIVNQSIPACTPPRLLDLVSGKSIWSALKVEGTPADSAWMKIMQCLVPTAENCCEFKANGKKFRATVGQNGVTETFLNRVNFWQYIGECLGLYSDEFPVLAIHSDRWMAKANDVVHGNTSQEILMREASAFLSRWDTLSTTNSYGIADHNVNGQTSSCEFFLESPEYGDRFALDTNGSLRTLQILDREDIDEYDLRVKVRRHANAEQYINVHVNVLDENDNAPELTMERKEFIIAENVAASIAITAFDPDYKENGTLSFALVNDNCDVCFINRTSGVITVNRIDADSVTNLAIPLKIAVSDLGKPTLSNSIEITLLVKDINDNSPQFKQADYTFMLSTSDKVGAIIGAVEAIDMDISGNVITYLTTDKYVEAIKDTGELRLSKLLPKSQTVHKFYVNASDSGTPNNSALVAVTIIVADLPTDTTTIERVVSIRKENVGQVVYKPEDQPGEFIYTSPLNETTADLVHVNERTGAIILKTWDNVSNFALNIDVRWRNSGDISRKEHLIFKISNLQGFQFDQLHYSTTIAKSTPVGAKIMAVRIMGDVYKYNITTEPAGQFNISSSGEVLLARDIDFEKPKVIRGIITAESNDGSTAEVTVSAEVFEDGGPMCKVNLSVTVHETIPVGTILDLPIPLCEYNKSRQQRQLVYSIADHIHFFTINATSSAVAVAQKLPSSVFNFTVSAVENKKVQEIEDNITISRSFPVGLEIYRMHSTDEDGDTLTYSIEADGYHPFGVNSEGVLTMKDSVASPGKICAKAVVTDSGIPRKTTKKDFCITFIDRVAQNPVIHWPTENSAHKFPENKKFEELFTINATVSPLFTGIDKSLHYRFTEEDGEDWRGFAIENGGSLNHNVPFNFEEKQKYNIGLESSMFDIEENVAVSETGLIVGEFPAAVDFDSSPEHSTICYVISSITTYSFFLPNDRIPVLYLNQSLDREYADQIQISIRAQDCSPENSVCVDPNINPTRADHSSQNLNRSQMLHLRALAAQIAKVPGNPFVEQVRKDQDLVEFADEDEDDKGFINNQHKGGGSFVRSIDNTDAGSRIDEYCVKYQENYRYYCQGEPDRPPRLREVLYKFCPSYEINCPEKASQTSEELSAPIGKPTNPFSASSQRRPQQQQTDGFPDPSAPPRDPCQLTVLLHQLDLLEGQEQADLVASEDHCEPSPAQLGLLKRRFMNREHELPGRKHRPMVIFSQHGASITDLRKMNMERYQIQLHVVVARAHPELLHAVNWKKDLYPSEDVLILQYDLKLFKEISPY
ncbi:hypothetical protein QR680_003472 [Steinernema hermaphroditum]|uniref:Cadherin domain-containing protein n=1 Tax=Steinernema hermaphroditum TaxID=289476 RepID=A0AA39H941_9BILA|nr:hypothetical protein QR680_003472 [Steinernema hermaphroditum]